MTNTEKKKVRVLQNFQYPAGGQLSESRGPRVMRLGKFRQATLEDKTSKPVSPWSRYGYLLPF